MRKGFLWAIVLLLTSTTLTKAQEGSATPLKQTLPDVKTASLRAPELSKSYLTPEEAKACCDPVAERPLTFWVNADYLLWWVKGGPVSTPLVTTSNSLTDQPPAALNQPGTRVLLGDRPLDYGAFSGIRIGAGMEIASGLALEGTYFVLERRSTHFSASSDAKGYPLLGHPFFNTGSGLEDALLIS